MLLRLIKELFVKHLRAGSVVGREAVGAALAAGDLVRAHALCQTLLAQQPDDVDALHLAGIIAHRQGDHARAVALLARAAQSETDPQPSLGLGYVLREAGEIQSAISHFERAVRISPNLYEARLALAHALLERGDLTGAEAHARHALTLGPDEMKANQLLAMVLCNQGRHEEAAHVVRRLQGFQLSDGRRLFLALLIPAIYESREHINRTREELSARIDELLAGAPLTVTDPVTEITITPFYLAYHGLNDRDLQQRIMRLCRRAYQPARSAALVPRRRNGKIKVGFVSEHFNSHSVARVNQGFISRMRRDRFEVTVFSLSLRDDAVARQIRASSDHYEMLGGQSLAQIEETIASREMDVLFFTDVGMDPLTYFLAYSRLAPLQCVGWGHPDTTGIDTLDVFISADRLELPDAQSHYTEKLARLSGWVMPGYRRPPRPAKTRSSLGLDERANLYVCPQQPFKIHPDFDEAVAAILRTDARGQVVFVQGQHPHMTERLKERFETTMPDVNRRIRILPHMNWTDYLGLIANADVMLDPFPFGGANTSYESLGLGVPVVTLPATYLRGRHSLGCYLRMGMTECVATTPQHYVEIAVRLGTDPGYRNSLAAAVSEASAVLFDNYETVKALEDFLEEATTVVR